MTFRSFDIHVTVVVAIKGSDYEPVDFDYDEDIFRDQIIKETLEGMRNANVDLADAYLEQIEEVESVRVLP